MSHFAGRLDDWRALYQGKPTVMAFDEATEAFGVEPAALLTWLRAGMPYVRAGDFGTGQGFLLRPAWILDWMIVMGCLAHAFGDIESVRKLKL